MAEFRAVLIEHGYKNRDIERKIIEAAGGEFIDAEELAFEAMMECCEAADGILVRRVRVTAEMIRRWRRCRIIVRYGVGTDNVDVDAATEAGVIVGHVPTYCIDDVSAHAAALLLACARDVAATHQRMREGAWEVRRPVPVFRVEGKTLGVVGLGRIGRAFVRKLSTWGLRILGVDPYVEPELLRDLPVRRVDMETLCGESDYISLHCPLLPETRHLIDRARLALMKPGVIVVNTSRGEVIDTQALLEKLEADPLARAGLDVFEQEPLPADHPIRLHPRVVLTDHMAWYSEQSQVELQSTAAQTIALVCKGGLPGSLANPQVLDRVGRRAEWVPAENMRWQLRRLEALGRS